MTINLNANEIVLKATKSEQLLEDGKVSGKFIITNQRIYFKALDNGKREYDMNLVPNQIMEVIYFNTRKILPNGLNVVMKSGESRRFILKKRNEFGQLINKMY